MTAAATYEEDHARILTSGPHTFTEDMRRKNLEFRQKVLHLLPIPDRFKLNDCDLLYRFLIARNWDFDATAKNIHDYIEWRKKERLDEIVTETFDPQIEQALATFFGLDTEGYPILFDTPDPKLVTTILKCIPKETMMRAHLRLMEQARYLSKVNGVDRISYVMDLTNISISTVTSAAVSFLKEVSAMDQRFYPEVMRRMLICNGGWMITGVWNVIKPLLDVRIQKKIRFFKELPSVVSLSEFISPQNMHPRYGGVADTSILQTQLEGASAALADKAQIGKAGPTDVEQGISPVHHEDELEEIPSMDMELYSIPSSSASDDEDDDDRRDPKCATHRPHMIVCASELAQKLRRSSGTESPPWSTALVPHESVEQLQVRHETTDTATSPALPPAPPLREVTPRVSSASPAMMTQFHLVRTSTTGLRGFIGDVLIGEKIDDQLFGPVLPSSVSGPSTASSPSKATISPSRFTGVVNAPHMLIGELLQETGHLIHSHVIIADNNRNAQFVLMRRNLHRQVIIFQVVGDSKIFTDKKLRHNVTGEKVKMATCGEREDSQDRRDWVVWGKIRVGSATTRKYLAEKRGSDVTFFSPLNSVSNELLLSLLAGLVQLWEL